MRAVTIRVNDVDGVAGFVLPGDRVDVALTRQADKNNTNDVVLQNVKVLAIDQVADERTDKPSIARAVTLEVNATDAQKLALAATVGTLSLMLRRAGEAKAADTRRVTLGDLANGGSACGRGRRNAEVRDHSACGAPASATTSACRSRMPIQRSGQPRGGVLLAERQDEFRGS